jgi:hypothetical protein
MPEFLRSTRITTNCWFMGWWSGRSCSHEPTYFDYQSCRAFIFSNALGTPRTSKLGILVQHRSSATGCLAVPSGLVSCSVICLTRRE